MPELRAWFGVSVRLRVFRKWCSEIGGSLGLAQVDIHISRALNPFWSPKWQVFFCVAGEPSDIAQVFPILGDLEPGFWK